MKAVKDLFCGHICRVCGKRVQKRYFIAHFHFELLRMGRMLVESSFQHWSNVYGARAYKEIHSPRL